MTSLFLNLPFTGLDRRKVWLRLTLLTATFLGLLASAPLWTNGHTFPLLPIARWFPILPPPWDKCRFGMMLLALVLAGWFYRAAATSFLVLALFAFFEDQNRGQPWFYMYWVMLLLTLLPAPVSIAACRCAIAAAYIWSGIQKFNARFFEVVPGWFVAPAAGWHLPSSLIELLRWAVMGAPFVEVAIGFMLWLPKLRWAAICVTIVLHSAALLFLGPLGYDYNWVVWPWNLAMIMLVFLLFAPGIGAPPRQVDSGPGASGKTKGRKDGKSPPAESALAFITRTFADLRQSRAAIVLLGLYTLLPLLSYSGRWDSYFSFSLYAENAATANIFVTQAFAERLPPPIRAHVHEFPQPYDVQRQGPYVLGFQGWGLEELHVPPISELRNFLSVFHFFRAYSREPNDLRMIVGLRGGPVVFYEGDRLEYLVPK